MCQNLPVRILLTPIHCSRHHQTVGKCIQESPKMSQKIRKKTPKMCQNLPVRILWTPIHCSRHHQTVGKCSHRSFRCHQLERLFWTASANAFCSVFRKDIPSWNWSAWKYFFWKSSLFFNLVFIGFYIQIICSNSVGKCSHRNFSCHQLERLFWTASAKAFCSVFRKDIPSWNWSAWKYFFLKIKPIFWPCFYRFLHPNYLF